MLIYWELKGESKKMLFHGATTGLPVKAMSE